MNDLVNLSDYSLARINAHLQLDPHLVSGNTVLEIGVGTGRCTRELVERGMIVHCLDIAEKGLDKIRDVATCWLESQLEELPDNYFDLAISNLVTQHLTNEQLKRQLIGVLRALRGVFAMQYACPLEGRAEIGVWEKPPCWSATRTMNTMEQMVAECGGVVSYHKLVDYYPDSDLGWNVIHVRRKPDGL